MTENSRYWPPGSPPGTSAPHPTSPGLTRVTRPSPGSYARTTKGNRCLLPDVKFYKQSAAILKKGRRHSTAEPVARPGQCGAPAVKCGVPCTTVQCGALHRGVLRCSAKLCGALHCNVQLRSAERCTTVPSAALPCGAAGPVRQTDIQSTPGSAVLLYSAV